MTRPLPYDDSVPALSQITVLECTWTDIPTNVREEVTRLWIDNEYGNDYYYFRWSKDFAEEYLNETYPYIAEYLKDNNIEECLIHYWW